MGKQLREAAAFIHSTDLLNEHCHECAFLQHKAEDDKTAAFEELTL